MAGVRIRWGGVARVAAIVVVALLGVRLLPDLLRAPEPPPLRADVGLPKAVAQPVVERPRTKPKPRPEAKTRKVSDTPASTAMIESHTRRKPEPPPRRHHRHPAPKTTPEQEEAASPPAPECAPPPAPEAAPEPLPEPPPEPSSAPGDGSEEFAPH